MGATEYLEEPADHLRAMVVGDWAAEKRALVERYIGASRAARQKYPHRSYIDLYCGPGRLFYRASQRFEDGCALAAWKDAVSQGVPFSQIIIGDVDSSNVDCCRRRLDSLNAPVQSFVGEAKQTVRRAIARTDPSGLHLAVLDPFSLGAMPFGIIATLGTVKRMDLLVHFSQNDLQRNLPLARAGEDDGALEAFAPGWRRSVTSSNQVTARSQFFRHWIGLVESVDGYKCARSVPLITNSKMAPLYKLMLFSRHPLGEKLWNSVAQDSQSDLF